MLFESGAIVLHIAERHGGLLPLDPRPAPSYRLDVCRPTTVEPPLVELEVAQLLEGDKSWSASAGT
jgi:glutathione S-transferase